MKKNKAEKRITICVPTKLFEQFGEMCDKHYLSMSEILRHYINECVESYRPENTLRENFRLNG